MSSFCVSIFNTLENPAENDSCFVTATKNLTLNKGSSYRITFLVSKNGDGVDLSSYSLRGDIRSSSTSDLILLNMSTSNLLLKIDTNNSAIIMNIPETFTRRIQQNIAIYNIELLNNNSETSKIVTGIITFV
jgi:hypothetical protein